MVSDGKTFDKHEVARVYYVDFLQKDDYKNPKNDHKEPEEIYNAGIEAILADKETFKKAQQHYLENNIEKLDPSKHLPPHLTFYDDSVPLERTAVKNIVREREKEGLSKIENDVLREEALYTSVEKIFKNREKTQDGDEIKSYVRLYLTKIFGEDALGPKDGPKR